MHWTPEFSSPQGVDTLQLYRSPGSAQPWVAGVDGGAGIVHGSACGPGPVVGVSSLSEYSERRHLRFGVRNWGCLSIGELATRIPSLESAVAQTSLDASAQADRLVSTTMAFRLADWQRSPVPLQWVSLSQGATPDDRALTPYSDSSGSAAHPTAGDAFTAALLEFVERQVWIAFWLTGGHAREIDCGASAASEELVPPASEFCRFRAFELVAGFPAYTVFCYCEEATPDGSQRFSCGVAASLNACEAFSKAVREMLHYRQFVEEKVTAVATRSSSAGRLEQNAVDFQSRGFEDVLVQRNVAGDKIGLTSFRKRDVLRKEELKRMLLTIGQDLFVYLGFEVNELGQYHVARVFGPSFYLHCDPGVRLNFDNAYARHLHVPNPPLYVRTSTCLP
jgi:hypothetical protein